MIGCNVLATKDVTKGRVRYDAAAFSTHAQRVAVLAPMLLAALPPGSCIAGHTEARETVWSDRATFLKLLRKPGTRSVALANVANAGNFGAIKPALNELVQACEECYKKSKEKRAR